MGVGRATGVGVEASASVSLREYGGDERIELGDRCGDRELEADGAEGRADVDAKLVDADDEGGVDVDVEEGLAQRGESVRIGVEMSPSGGLGRRGERGVKGEFVGIQDDGCEFGAEDVGEDPAAVGGGVIRAEAIGGVRERVVGRRGEFERELERIGRIVGDAEHAGGRDINDVLGDEHQ